MPRRRRLRRKTERSRVRNRTSARSLEPTGPLVQIPLQGSVTVAIVTGDISASYARTLWATTGIVIAAYVVVFLVLAPLALQDYLNHLARAWVLADLVFHNGARFGTAFQYHFAAIPYVLGDLLLAGVTELLGTAAAASLWSVFVFLSLPCALLFYLSKSGARTETRALLLILSLYLSTDWFFLVGFLEFRLGLAVTLVAVALADSVRQKPSRLRYAAYAVVVLLGYLTHLSTLVFIAAAIGMSALIRLRLGSTSWRQELALLLPCGAALIWHFASGYAFRAPGDLVEVPYLWDGLRGKLPRLRSEFARSGRGDGLMSLLLAGCMLLYVGRVDVRTFKSPRVLEMFALTAAFLGIYFALPLGYPEAYYVDIRALPLACLFWIFGMINLRRIETAGRKRRQIVAVGMACMLAIGNLAYLVEHFTEHRAWLTQYRQVIHAIPRNARVLPVYTHGPDGAVVPYLHAYSFAIIDRDNVVPYLQTGDTGNPEKYLRYRQRPYMPAEGWYGDIDAPKVDWRAVACAYDFVLITKPYDIRRLQVPLTPIAENESASLFALPQKTGCPPAGARVPGSTLSVPTLVSR